MDTTHRQSRGFGAFLIVLLLAPGASRANGLWSNMLQKTVGTVVSKVENQVSSASRRATPPPGRPSQAGSVQPPSGNANQNPNAVPLVRAFQPVVPTDFGTAEDLLGIRLGMSMRQAEQIARKTYPDDPITQRRRFVFSYKEVTVQSLPFVRYLQFAKTAASTTDQLLLEFSSPVGDHRIISMSRLITFDPQAANEPLVSSIEANLLKKFGAPSWKNTGGGVTEEWLFQGKSRVPCPSGGCAAQPTRKNADFGLGSTPLLASNVGDIDLSYGGGGPYSLGAAEDRKVQVVLLCGNSITTTGTTDKLIADDVVRIRAQIGQNGTDQSKAQAVSIDAYYTRPCVDDIIDARPQLRAAAIKRYDSISKTPSAPTF